MNVESVVLSQKEYYHTNATKDVFFRKQSLQKLLVSIKENESLIYEALRKDLNKSEQESYITEVNIVTTAIKNAISYINKWSKPIKIKTPIPLFPSKSYVVRDPYGVVLILSPWNYPFGLALTPLVGAIAAGNCAVLKTSKSSPNTSAVIAKIINHTFDSKYIYAIDESVSYDDILSCPYDYIFFTGSERVGRVVMRTASEKLIPVSLELGGKSPCIIDKSANIKLAAKRIIWGKIINAGQTCVAPDYVLIHEDVKKEFIEEAKKYILQFLKDPFDNDNYPRIVNLHHFIRLKNLIQKEKDVIGGKYDDKQLKIEPTLFTSATFNSNIMKDEIFGPILPIISYKDLDSVIDIVKKRPKPLACYIFGRDHNFIDKIITEISFGGGCVNDTVMHLANDNLPFGGIGNSGMGSYHGKYSFDTFSHQKSILMNKSQFDNNLRYPPYKEKTYKFLRRLLK